MLRNYGDAKAVQLFPGVVRRTMNSGDRTTMVEVTFAAGAMLPIHAHVHEQAGYLVRGRLVLQFGEEEREVQAGDAWVIPGDMPHGVRAVEPSVAVEVFSPVRTEYVDW